MDIVVYLTRYPLPLSGLGLVETKLNPDADYDLYRSSMYTERQSLGYHAAARKDINYQTTLLVDAINRGEIDAPAMPISIYRQRGIKKTAARAAVARVLSSAARQNAVSRRRSLMPLARLGGRMPASSTEQKNIDNNLTGAAALIPLAVTGVVTLLNGVAQGTTATTRLGRRITMKSLLIKGEVLLAPTSAGTAPLRFLVVYDMQTNATAPAATDVLVVDQLNSPMNLSNSRRFKTLCDIEIPCIGTGGPQSVSFTRYVKLNHAVEFNTGSAGTVGDIQTGSVYMLSYQGGNIITTAPNANVYTRVRFTDN